MVRNYKKSGGRFSNRKQEKTYSWLEFTEKNGEDFLTIEL